MARAEKSAAHPKRETSAAASRAGAGTAESGAPEASHQAGPGSPSRESDGVPRFGPLPLVLRPSPPGDGKVERNRRGRRIGGGRTIILYWLIGVVLGAGVVWALTTALAQQQKSADPKPVSPPRPQQQQSQQQQQAQQPPLPVSTEQALYLIRSTLLTLNDANRSGNYTVLRDLAAPDFQARNTAADLSQSFSDLRRRNFDLYGAALLSPQLTALPALDQRGFLRLTGYFPTKPQQINFDLLFVNVANQWRLFGISVATPDAPSAAR